MNLKLTTNAVLTAVLAAVAMNKAQASTPAPTSGANVQYTVIQTYSDEKCTKPTLLMFSAVRPTSPCASLACSSQTTIKCSTDVNGAIGNAFGTKPYASVQRYSDGKCTTSDGGTVVPIDGVCYSYAHQSFKAVINSNNTVSIGSYADNACRNLAISQLLSSDNANICIGGLMISGFNIKSLGKASTPNAPTPPTVKNATGSTNYNATPTPVANGTAPGWYYATPGPVGNGTAPSWYYATPGPVGNGTSSGWYYASPAPVGNRTASGGSYASPAPLGNGSAPGWYYSTPGPVGNGTAPSWYYATPGPVGNGTASGWYSASPAPVGNRTASGGSYASPAPLGNGSAQGWYYATPGPVGNGTASSWYYATPGPVGNGTASGWYYASPAPLGNGSAPGGYYSTPGPVGNGTASSGYYATPGPVGNGTASGWYYASPAPVGNGAASGWYTSTPGPVGNGTASSSYNSTPGSAWNGTAPVGNTTAPAPKATTPAPKPGTAAPTGTVPRLTFTLTSLFGDAKCFGAPGIVLVTPSTTTKCTAAPCASQKVSSCADDYSKAVATAYGAQPYVSVATYTDDGCKTVAAGTIVTIDGACRGTGGMFVKAAQNADMSVTVGYYSDSKCTKASTQALKVTKDSAGKCSNKTVLSVANTKLAK